MTLKKSIGFIINPISGKGNNSINKSLLYKEFSDYNKISIRYTERYGHAKEITKLFISDGYDIIVACGGDGTINEIASELVGSKTKLAIIPLGSGNGLASNLNISKNILHCISTIKKCNVKQIDVGRINDNYFFSNCGLGFDSEVIYHYHNGKSRKLIGYLKAIIASLKSYNFKNNFNIKIDNKQNITLKKPFMVFVSNSNEMGYGFSLTPNSKLDDGYLELVVVQKTNVINIILFSLFMLLKKHNSLSYVFTKKIKSLKAYTSKEYFQADGESFNTNAKDISISINHEKLNIIF